MNYIQKDLGYPREGTTAKLRVTMPDGSRWDVPVQVIADSRDENYAEDHEDTVEFIRSGELDNYEITDWAANNMNWSEVEKFAVQVNTRRTVDWQEGWINGEKEVVGEI